MKKKTLYEFLGVEPDATPEEIKAAAVYSAKKFNPNRYPGNPRVLEHFNKVKLVYNILSNPQKRAAYDAHLKKLVENTAEANKDNINLWKGESIVYRVNAHWFGYFEISLLVLMLTYFLFYPTMLHQWLTEIEPYVALCFQGVLLLSILILLYTLLRQFTTILIITSRRTIIKFNFLPKKQIEISHAQFEGIKIKPSILCHILDFGALKIVARGKKGIEGIKVGNVVSPKTFEKRLMQIIKHSAYHRI